MLMKAPPKPAIRPEKPMAMYLTLRTLTPTEDAALGFSPTERMFRPRGVR